MMIDNKTKVKIWLKAKDYIQKRIYYGLCYSLMCATQDITGKLLDKDQIHKEFGLLKYKPLEVKLDNFWWLSNDIQTRFKIIETEVKLLN